MGYVIGIASYSARSEEFKPPMLLWVLLYFAGGGAYLERKIPARLQPKSIIFHEFIWRRQEKATAAKKFIGQCYYRYPLGEIGRKKDD